MILLLLLLIITIGFVGPKIDYYKYPHISFGLVLLGMLLSGIVLYLFVVR